MSRVMCAHEEANSCLAGNASLVTTMTLTRAYVETYHRISQMLQGVSVVGLNYTTVQDLKDVAVTLVDL
jgi:hypothetical protein